ncbi:MAG: PaaI family thioesterase [Thermoanaerobaculaceae bacterium]|nr:PaaI family thioesterase [Thermoanaerobaculaceae bacterium]
MHLPEPHIWEEPAWGAYASREDLERPGLERMRLLARPDSLQPPISHLTGLSYVEVGAGLTTCAMPASRWFLAATGGFSGGVLALPADAALGGALVTLLEPGQILTTSELSLSYLRPATASAGALIARGRLVHASRTLGLSDVFIEDGRGRLLAHGSSRCVFLPTPARMRFPPPKPRPDGVPDPYRRPAVGEPVEEMFGERGYKEMFDAWQRDELPAPPLCNFFGLRPVEHAPGTMTWALPATEWLNNAFGVIYGGALAILADSAIAGAIWMTMDRGQILASLNLHVYFFRPVLADGRDMVGRGTVTRSGRSLRVAGAEVFDADGNLVAMGTGSAKLVSDRRASLQTQAPPEG